MHCFTALLAGIALHAMFVLSAPSACAQGRTITEYPFTQSFAFIPAGTSTTPSGPIGAAVFPTTNADGGEFAVDAGTNSLMVNGSTTGLNNNLGAGGAIRIQTSGSAAPTTSQGFVLHCSFASRDAASVSIGWTKVSNGTSTRTNELRIALSTDAGPYNDLAAAQFTNSATSQSGMLTAVIPESARGAISARFRISSVNVSGTGTHPRVVVDNLSIAALDDAPLPVELAAFSASYLDARVGLVWTTASEFNNAGFEVQRALASDSVFAPLASYLAHEGLRGLGTSSRGREYRYIDELSGSNADDGTVLLYRLIDIATDGARREHAPHVVHVQTSNVVEPGMTVVALRFEPVSPNPADDHVIARWIQAREERVMLEIVDAAGRTVGRQVSEIADAGNHEMSITTSMLASGAYTLVVRSALATRTQPFVVMR